MLAVCSESFGNRLTKHVELDEIIRSVAPVVVAASVAVLLLVSEPHAASPMAKAANPAASLLILIVSPWL
jgi:hypothetical protein